MPSPDQFKIWKNKAIFLPYKWLLLREHLPAEGSFFSPDCLKHSVSACCSLAEVHCKTSLLLFAPGLKHSTELFKTTSSSKHSLSQRTEDFRLYKQNLSVQVPARWEERQTTSFFLTPPTQRLVLFLFALIFTLLTQTLMLQKCKTAPVIKMLSGHIDWIAQVFISPSISALSLPSTSFFPEGGEDMVECAAFKLQIPVN